MRVETKMSLRTAEHVKNGSLSLACSQRSSNLLTRINKEMEISELEDNEKGRCCFNKELEGYC